MFSRTATGTKQQLLSNSGVLPLEQSSIEVGTAHDRVLDRSREGILKTVLVTEVQHSQNTIQEHTIDSLFLQYHLKQVIFFCLFHLFQDDNVGLVGK